MATEVTLPRLGQGMESGTIVRWLKSEGDTVDRDEPLYELDTEKVTQEVEAGGRGRPPQDPRRRGEEIEVGKPICVIGEAGEEIRRVDDAAETVRPRPRRPRPPPRPRARPSPRRRTRRSAAERRGARAGSRAGGRAGGGPRGRRSAGRAEDPRARPGGPCPRDRQDATAGAIEGVAARAADREGARDRPAPRDRDGPRREDRGGGRRARGRGARLGGEAGSGHRGGASRSR